MRLTKKENFTGIKKALSIVMALFCLAPCVSIASETVSVYQSTQYVSHPREAFVLFYMSSCIHCQHFDPVLKEYAKLHHIPVLAYTLDGKSLPSFPKSVTPSQEESHQFFPSGNPVVPALFVMDMSSKKIISILKGEATWAQLKGRMREFDALVNGGGHD